MTCQSGLIIKGEHFPCDWPTDESGKHDGWGHTNKQAEAVWSDDRQLAESMARGLADSHAGRVRDLGDFTQYADTAGDPAK